MSRRSDIPPYEIMRQQRLAEQASSKKAERVEPVDSADPGLGPSPWWVGASVPIVLRIPRGLAVLCGVGLLLLLVLAYWVGASRGWSAAQSELADQQTDRATQGGTRGVGAVSISRLSEGEQEQGSSDSGDAGPVEIHTSLDERRERGLNYFRLVRTSREEGEQIAAFMAQAQIDIQLVLLDNDERCIVYSVERGFRSDERNSDARRQHESHLRALGNQWRALGSGRSHSNFNTMILDLYEGP